MSISDRLDQIATRAEKATEGPWGAHDHPVLPASVYQHDAQGGTVDVVSDSAPRMADAEFIASARTDLPALVAALRAVLDCVDYHDQGEGCHALPDDIRHAIEAALGEDAL